MNRDRDRDHRITTLEDLRWHVEDVGLVLVKCDDFDPGIVRITVRARPPKLSDVIIRPAPMLRLAELKKRIIQGGIIGISYKTTMEEDVPQVLESGEILQLPKMEKRPIPAAIAAVAVAFLVVVARLVYWALTQ